MYISYPWFSSDLLKKTFIMIIFFKRTVLTIFLKPFSENLFRPKVYHCVFVHHCNSPVSWVSTN